MVSHLEESTKRPGVVEDGVREVDEGLYKGTQAGKHADAAVLELNSAAPEEGGLILGESKRVEDATSLDISAQHVRDGHGNHASAPLGDGGGGHEGSGSADKGEKGNSADHLLH